MTALARAAAPCPRLWKTTTLRNNHSTSSTTASPSLPRRTLDSRILRCYATYYTTSTVCSRRQPPSPSAQQCRTFRSTSAARSNDLAKRNHYERLQVAPGATPAEIKKSFYKLSKAHHPDANRDDPNAASTFSLLSESYTLLSDPSRRAVYDRDVMRRLQQEAGPRASPHGSYHSSSAYSTGGRPASGLSKRRGTFRGPPPSFYRSGGWGTHAEKRRRAHEESTSYSSSSASSSSSRQHDAHAQYSNYQSAGAAAGANTDDAFTSQQGPGGRFYHEEDDVPSHFDKEGHRRTHENEDKRRWARRKRALDDEDMEFEPQTSLAAHFVIMLGILGATVLVPVIYLNTLRGKKKREY